VLDKVREAEGNCKGELLLKKMPSDSTTIPKIKQLIKKEMARGFKPDLVLIDYIDCVQPTKVFGDEWSGEGNVMRQFETMLSEMNLAGWAAVQTNRGGINTEFVDTDQIGGSIKKAQIGHFIVTVAKSALQRENDTANMAIVKSRFGKDGIQFHNCIFNNGTIDIQMLENDAGNTLYQEELLKKSNHLNDMNQFLAEAKTKFHEGRQGKELES
jgi:hypothetical protein